MSRARQHTTIHVVADDLDQAVEDLQRDWAHEHRPRWAIDTGTPDTHPLQVERCPDVARRPPRQPATGPPDGRTPRRPGPARSRRVPIAVPHPASSAAGPRGPGPRRRGTRTVRRRRAHRRRPGTQRRPESPCSRRADRHRPRPQLAGPPPLGTGSRSQPSRRTRRRQRLDRARRTPPPEPHRRDPPARGEPPVTAHRTRPRPARRTRPEPRTTRPNSPRGDRPSHPSATRSRTVPIPLAATERHPGPRPRAVGSRSHRPRVALRAGQMPPVGRAPGAALGSLKGGLAHRMTVSATSMLPRVALE